MGADAFTVYYGLRFHVTEVELDMVQERAHPHQIAARKFGLRCYFGRPTNGLDHFLLVGAELGVFGIENKMDAMLTDEQIRTMTEAARRKLKEAGFVEEPAFIFQLVADY